VAPFALWAGLGKENFMTPWQQIEADREAIEEFSARTGAPIIRVPRPASEPQSANAVKAQAANESSEERQQNEFEKEGKS
jgi:hypothetical protein